MADDATNCLNSFQRASKKFDLVSHQIGSAAVGKGYWHENYETSKDEGTHRHNYSEPLRKAAANKFIAEQIAYERERRALNSHSTSTSTTENTARGIEGNVGDSKGIVGINGSRTVENGIDKTTTFETGKGLIKNGLSLQSSPDTQQSQESGPPDRFQIATLALTFFSKQLKTVG